MSLRDAIGWAKQHPYMLAGGVFVGGAVLIFAYYSRSGSTAAPASSDTAQLQAQVASEAVQAQYAAQVSAAQIQASSVATQVNGAVAINSKNAEVSEANIAAQQTIGLAGISAQRDVQLAGITGQTQLAQIQADASTHQTDALFNYLSSELLSNAEYNQLSGQIGQVAARNAQISNDQGTLTAALENLSSSTGRDANRLNTIWTEVNGGPGTY